MSTVSFLGSYLDSNVKAFRDGVLKTIVSFDPQGASEAQLAEYGKAVHQLEEIASKAEAEAQAAETNFANLKAEVEKHAKASDILRAQVDAEVDPAKKAAKQAALDKVEADGNKLFDDAKAAKETATDSRQYAEEVKKQHLAAVDRWRTGQARLQQAVHDQERAKHEAEIAASRRADAERLAGLTSGIDTGDIAIDAMKANTAKLHQQAEGAKMTANALTAASATDDIAAQALAQASAVDAAPVRSLKDRLGEL